MDCGEVKWNEVISKGMWWDQKGCCEFRETVVRSHGLWWGQMDYSEVSRTLLRLYRLLWDQRNSGEVTWDVVRSELGDTVPKMQGKIDMSHMIDYVHDGSGGLCKMTGIRGKQRRNIAQQTQEQSFATGPNSQPFLDWSTVVENIWAQLSLQRKLWTCLIFRNFFSTNVLKIFNSSGEMSDLQYNSSQF
jgi:hypothetical protein